MSEDTAANNKRIAKNTLFLYGRMILIMAVSLYTSRVVLATLGEEDFGIYNIVAGVVVLFSFLNSVMIRSTQRFLNYEMGRGDKLQIKRVFSMAVNCHLIIIGAVFLLSETVGLWFLNTYLNIPPGRMAAANWVYQFSILSTCISIFYAPYDAAIIAYEKMSVYAYVSILEAFLKLGIVFLLIISSFDKLIFYGSLIAFVSIITSSFYIGYSIKHFEACSYTRFWNKGLFRSMMSFSGWSLLGGVANMGTSQGLNIILNIFFSVVVNAAMGIANQVINAINSFVGNFATAFNPQIVKSYAAGDTDYFTSLVHRTSKVCYFLLLALGLPIIICCDGVLDIWLKEVPEHAVSFCRLIIIIALVDSINNPVWTSIWATGKVRTFNIVTSFIRLSALPICVLGFYLGLPPEFALVINLVVSIINQTWCLFHMKSLMNFNLLEHFRMTILPCIFVTVLSIPGPLFIYHLNSGKLWTLAVLIVTFIITLAFILLIGLTHNERKKICSFVLNKIRRQ